MRRDIRWHFAGQRLAGEAVCDDRTAETHGCSILWTVNH
jgi:hypothetical protein